VHNNPLSLTDPSGFFSFKKFFRTAVSVAITAFAPQLLPFASFVNVAAAGAVAGFIATGSVEGALVGAFTAGVFHGIGQGFANLPADSALRGSFLGTKLSAGGLALKSLAHAATGGVLSSVQGGKFVHGFTAAGVTQFASGGIGLIGGEGFSPLRVAAAAVLGGSVSEISGGKFANGAVTAAMSFSFGQLAQRSATGNEQTDLLSMSDEELDALIASQFDDEAFLNRDFLLAECGGCIQQDIMQREFLAGRITEDQLLRFHTAQGVGAAIGLSAHPAIRFGVPAARASLTGLGRFLGPRGPIFGDTAFGAARQGILNHGRLRIGFGRHRGAQFRTRN